VAAAEVLRCREESEGWFNGALTFQTEKPGRRWPIPLPQRVTGTALEGVCCDTNMVMIEYPTHIGPSGPAANPTTAPPMGADGPRDDHAASRGNIGRPPRPAWWSRPHQVVPGPGKGRAVGGPATGCDPLLPWTGRGPQPTRFHSTWTASETSERQALAGAVRRSSRDHFHCPSPASISDQSGRKSLGGQHERHRQNICWRRTTRNSDSDVARARPEDCGTPAFSAEQRAGRTRSRDEPTRRTRCAWELVRPRFHPHTPEPRRFRPGCRKAAEGQRDVSHFWHHPPQGARAVRLFPRGTLPPTRKS